MIIRDRLRSIDLRMSPVISLIRDAHLLSLQYVDGALTVRTSKQLEASPYAKYHGKIITLPNELIYRPAPEVVSQHLEKFRASEVAKGSEGTSLQTVQ
ncbi:hypothetical protein QCM77_30270 [Bradyrhizobium sp. SSUT18]|uniref:hypothetical protein n=1 Tax=Bradyrhizobium sp. SSUT18 TaxID=3040602 RepID=UPI00244817D2|nr:hypothetical protein [Bradyrhizobium sp. SSUT18]MDH2404206.1 hypothetical protein [Bradyrhizobium sp. SSUT18]